MATNLRVFLLDDDDRLHQISRACYERLIRGEPEERLAKFAGQRIRCAVVVVETTERKPIAVNRIVYSFLTLDGTGRLDILERERETQLAMDSIPPLHSQIDSPQVIDARHFFARKRYEREFRWRPTTEIESAILDIVLRGEPNP
jgi:hypothetical protein